MGLKVPWTQKYVLGLSFGSIFEINEKSSEFGQKDYEIFIVRFPWAWTENLLG